MIYHPTYLLAEACQLKMCLHNTNIHLVLKIPFVWKVDKFNLK